MLRIQRGKPANRVTISCYRHPSCNILVNESRAPSDQDVFSWLYEVEPVAQGMSKEERQELARRHKKLARDRWTAPRP